jgi:4'-phosphopantetheinyl transferase
MAPEAAGPSPPPLRPLLWWPGRRFPAPSPGGRSSPVVPRAPWLVLADRADPRLAPAAAALEPLLDGGERERQGRFRREDDRHRFLLGRGLLRLALGAWLGRDPASLRFRSGSHGKPELAAAEVPALHFNLAHSADLILLAFHPGCPVGVDVGRLRPDLAWEPLARRLLSPAACSRLQQLPPEQGPAAFLAAWCRLEARLKARGEGLAGLERLQQADLQALRQAAFSAPQEAAGGAGAAAGEKIWTVAVPRLYRAAVALVPPLAGSLRAS